MDALCPTICLFCGFTFPVRVILTRISMRIRNVSRLSKLITRLSLELKTIKTLSKPQKSPKKAPEANTPILCLMRFFAYFCLISIRTYKSSAEVKTSWARQ